MTSVLVQSLPSQAVPASGLADALEATYSAVALHTFPDGELLPRVEAARTVIAYWSLHPANTTVMSLLLAADAWRRAGVERLILVAPYLCYLRQDAVFAEGQPVSRDVIGGLLAPRFDRFLTVEAHLHRSPSLAAVFPGKRADNLSAAGPLAAALGREAESLVVGPDGESGAWAQRLAGQLGCDWLTLSKQRRGDRDVVVAGERMDRVSGRRVILTDDIASSGQTLIAAARLLKAAGAASVEAAVAHAFFDKRTAWRLRQAGVTRLVSTDSVEHPTNSAPLASLLAEALKDEIKR